MEQDIDQDLVDKQSRELVEAYMQVYYTVMQGRIEEPISVEDLVTNVQAATELLANMILSVAGVLQVGQVGTNMPLNEIVDGLMVDTLSNLEGLLKMKVETAVPPVGRIINPQVFRNDH